MKIGIAQLRPVKGDIEKNIAIHKKTISIAVSKKADAIFFSELSITGYEPEFANELKIESNDKRFDVFQEISNSENIIIGLGAPTKFNEGVQISMLVFQPNLAIQKYAKQILHEDELPFFQNGDKQTIINNNEVKIAPAICYESLQIEHLENVIEIGANVYLASVAKSQKGIDKANAYFPSVAKRKSITILMSNCIGFCDTFESVGQSAVWDKKGNLIGQLSNNEAGILIYDTIGEHMEKIESLELVF